jgi:hypothetical protein
VGVAAVAQTQAREVGKRLDELAGRAVCKRAR